MRKLRENGDLHEGMKTTKEKLKGLYFTCNNNEALRPKIEWKLLKYLKNTHTQNFRSEILTIKAMITWSPVSSLFIAALETLFGYNHLHNISIVGR